MVAVLESDVWRDEQFGSYSEARYPGIPAGQEREYMLRETSAPYWQDVLAGFDMRLHGTGSARVEHSSVEMTREATGVYIARHMNKLIDRDADTKLERVVVVYEPTDVDEELMYYGISGILRTPHRQPRNFDQEIFRKLSFDDVMRYRHVGRAGLHWRLVK
ncbi:MAG: hypothetical protein JWS12_771 [Candidatus Saccharibacteria bacterium]|nr:hypothetical protein [Candidatus Saccharibacteria bacterium]